MREEGLKNQNSGYTLEQASSIYLNDTNYQKRSVNTDRGYKGLLKNWILPELGNIKIRNINENDLERLYNKMRNYINSVNNKPLSETYACHAHKLIKAVYNYAKKKKWVLSNPTDYVINPPKMKLEEREYYNYEEMLEVYKLLENYDIRFKTAITILFNSGLRRGELFGLKWKDVVYKKTPTIRNGIRTIEDTTILKINKEVVAMDKKVLKSKDFKSKYDIIEIISDTLVASKPKTKKSIRNIIVVNKCYKLLEEYKQYQMNNGFNITDNDYIFKTFDNISVWNPNYLTKEWNRFIKDNNLKKITIHDIRHSHATYLLSLGIPPQDVARRLGHSEPNTTLKIYNHSNLSQDQKIVNIIDENAHFNDNTNKDNIEAKTTLSLLLSDNIDINNKELYSAIEFICNKKISYDEIDDHLEICKKHILDNNPSLKDFYNFASNLNYEDKNKLINSISSILNNNSIKLEPIKDIYLYDDFNIKIQNNPKSKI